MNSEYYTGTPKCKREEKEEIAIAAAKAKATAKARAFALNINFNILVDPSSDNNDDMTGLTKLNQLKDSLGSPENLISKFFGNDENQLISVAEAEAKSEAESEAKIRNNNINIVINL